MSEGEFRKLRNKMYEETLGLHDTFVDRFMAKVDEALKEFPDENDSRFDTWENEDERNIFNPHDYIEAVKEWRLKYLGDKDEGQKEN